MELRRRFSDWLARTEEPGAKETKPSAKPPATPAAKPKPAAKPSEGKKPSTGLWFRLTTRFTAIGYWIREKAQSADRNLRGVTEWLEKAGAFVAGLWTERSRETRWRILGVLGVAVLYLLLKFAPVPLVPCSVSSYKECAPEDGTVALVPADALLYAHVTLDDDTEQFEYAEDLADRLPEGLVSAVVGGLPVPSVATLDIRENIVPWAERDIALTLIAGPKKS